MNCMEVRRYLDAAIDLELEPELMFKVDNHVSGCQDCRAVQKVKKDLKKELFELGQIKAPAHLRGKISEAANRRRVTKKITLVAAGPLAAAAAVLLMFKLSSNAPSQEPVAAVVEDVVARHVRELPMEVKGPDASKAASWFRGKVDFPVQAPSLALKQASFEGARLSNVRSHQAAHMAYLVDGHRVTLMIFNSRSAMFTGAKRVMVGEREVLLSHRNGFNVAIFLDGDMAYVLSSDLPEHRLLEMVAQFGR